ncbi:CaiB/BaiF CoA transferase family protein [Paeniglutamicibacter sp. MACA_103]|uniref:CaiB/BaiF CoA transferase family protein n=1 Tax=Paeniglutamicibacter sp. MACA_103 TaxID=3377337 RepID=UPI003895DF4E
MLYQSLSGVKVLDLSRIMAGPWCTQNLSDLGAEVLKVESPGLGDDTRGWGDPYLAGTTEEDGFSAYFISANRGKRSLAVNFADPEGSEIVRRLARDADVVVENFKTGSLRKYGLDYEALREINPNLVYLSITGFGQTGPMAQFPGYDYVFQGMGGLMSYTGLPDGQPGAMPLRTGVAVVDLMTGMYATSAVLAALYQRLVSGQGQHLDIALLDVAVAMNANQGSNYLVTGKNPQRTGNAHPNCAPYEVFETGDGFMILAIGNDGQFGQFCKVAERGDLATDSRFTTNSQRLANMPQLRPILAEVLKDRTSAQWQAELDAVGVPWGPINTLEQVFEHPQVKHRQLRLDAEHADHGTIPMVRNPLTTVSPSGREIQPPPGRGEHSRTVLEELGMSHEEIDELLSAGVIAEMKEYSK